MTRSSTLALLSAALLLAACSEKPQRTLAPRPELSLSSTASTCGLTGDDDFDGDDPVYLLNRGARRAATAQLDSVRKSLRLRVPGPDTAGARVHAFQLIDILIHAYRVDSIAGGQTAATRTATTGVINSVLCYVGLPTSFTVAALGADGAAGIVSPTSAPTTIVTDTRWAGMQVPTGSVSQPVLVTVVRLPDSPNPLLTQLDQYPIYYEFHVTPEGAVAAPMVIGVCQAVSTAAPDPTRLRVAHNVAPFTPGSIEILPLVPTPFLDCTTAGSALAPTGNRLLDFARAGWRRVGPLLASVVGPARLSAAPLYATSGVGGTTRNFSPFGLVDTLVVMTANSPTTQSAPVGTAVVTPSVTLRTPGGHLFSGLPVTFAVTAGGGSVTGASAISDVSGVATAGSWTLGLAPGVNTVDATATPPHLGSGVAGSPLTFTATGIAPAVQLVSCGPSEGAGDELTRAFYHPSYPGATLKQVTVYLASNARARSPATYGIQLIARAGGFNGPVIGTSTVTVPLRGNPSENRATTFAFAGEPAVVRNSVVTFQFNVTSNPTGAKLYFNTGRGDCDDDDHRGVRCPVVETRDAGGTLSTFRHQGVAIKIVGAP